jgi:thymidylate synthase
MNNLDPQYQSLLQDILDNGVEKSTRNGKVISVFGRQIRHSMKTGFPLLTTKKMYFKGIVTELLWFLRGDTNIKFLVDNGCHIWDGDCFANYIRNFSKYVDSLPENGEAEFIINKDKFINKIKTDDEFAKKWGELGPIYGKQWRDWLNLKWEATDKADPSHPDRPMLKWKLEGIDQIANLINDLKTNPDSRRLMVNAWNVGELDQMVLPPCHFSFQCYSHEKEGKRYLSLAWNQRSVDFGLGAPFNIASYGLLLEIIAKEVNMIPDELIGNLGDVHLYLDHVEPIKEQLNRKPFELPTLKIHSNIDDISHYKVSDFELIGYQYHPTIKLPLSN